MQKVIIFILMLSTAFVSAQNVVTDSQTYSAQQLIEDILIDSNCITNVQVTNVIGGNFGSTDKSYGYFDASGTTFPFQSGIVLSTGRLNNVNGPNTTLSDDNATNWLGDSDLETALNENNTTNATVIEFQFTATTTQISFNYIFASEEYQEGNSNTCQYSDLFGFLIRESGQLDYQNIALVPETQTPVKVTTVHPAIPGGCPAENQFYFGSWNNTTSPINFNGQTKVLSANAITTPNTTYQVKLVIADEQNYRYDSAVFLEAGSFELTTDLGPNLLSDTNNALCPNSSVTLDAFQSGNNTYAWFKDNVLLTSENNATLIAQESGVYNVEVTLENGCISYGQLIIEQQAPLNISNTTLLQCDLDPDGITYFNLLEANIAITNGDNSLSIDGYYTSQTDAEQQINTITNPDNYQNTTTNQIVFAVITSNQSSCTTLSEITLSTANNTLPTYTVETCDDTVIDGYSTFNLNTIVTQIQTEVPTNATITFYSTLDNAFAESNPLPINFENTQQDTQTIIVRVKTDTNDCYALTEVQLDVLNTPMILANENISYCPDNYPENITLEGGILNDAPSNYNYQWLLNGVDINLNTASINVNQTGTYTVVISNPNGCSNTRDITVTNAQVPIIENIDVSEQTNNNTITVNLSNTGSFEFSLDTISFQNSNQFLNIPAGIHSVYVRESNGCGLTQQTIAILGFPKYFTPNGDIYNQYWKPVCITPDFNANLDIKIFDRYGKLLYVITPEAQGWDGTLNGQPLPTSDYWYQLQLKDGVVVKGHFTLKR